METAAQDPQRPATEAGPDRSQDGATSLEWALLIAGIALLSYPIINLALATLIGHYRMITTLNALPFP